MSDSAARRTLVLVVDDDPQIRAALVTVLEANGYETESAATGEEAIAAARIVDADVVVTDLGLPDMDGLAVCHALRKFTDVPILVLTVRDDEQDKIVALDTGADDYLTKPFSTGELLARIRALQRRAPARHESQIVTVGNLEIDLERRTVLKEGGSPGLTGTELEILLFLAERAGRVVPAAAIITHVWGPSAKSYPQLLRVHVSNIRRKIEPNQAVPTYLLTEPGVGFRLLQ